MHVSLLHINCLVLFSKCQYYILSWPESYFMVVLCIFTRVVMQWTLPCRYTCMHQHCVLALCLFVFVTHHLMQLILPFIYFLCTSHFDLMFMQHLHFWLEMYSFARTVMQWTLPCRYTRMHQHCILALCLFVFVAHGLMQLILPFIYFLCTRHFHLMSGFVHFFAPRELLFVQHLHFY